MMEIKPIHTKAEHKQALKEIETLITTKADTLDGDRLDILVTMVEAYEKKHYPIDLPDPVEPFPVTRLQDQLVPMPPFGG
jgi:HTH-type transcriptional regulator/antitoxin HigA